MVYVGEFYLKCLLRNPTFTFIQAGISCEWANDSQHLLLEHFDAICHSPSQLYHSALPFSPSSSLVHRYYNAGLSREVKVVKGLPSEWGPCFRTVTFDSQPLGLAYWKGTIAAGLESGNIITLDGTTGSQGTTLSSHTDWVRCLNFSSDGMLLASGSDDTTVKLWEVQTGGVIKTFHGHTSWVYSVSILTDGMSLLSGSDDTTIKLWDVQTGEVIKTFHGHTGWVYSISILVDGTTFASGSHDKTIRLWDIQTGGCYHIIEQQDEVQNVTLSPINSQSLVFASGNTVQHWDISSHQLSPSHYNSYVSFSLDGTQLVSCQGVGTATQNSNSGAIVAKFHNSGDTPNNCCFSPDGRLVAIAVGTCICILDITGLDPHLVDIFTGHTRTITSLVFSSPSSLISSSCDQSVKFWQISTLSTDPVVGHPKPTPLHSVSIKSITLQAKDGVVVSNDLDGMVRTWDVSTGFCKESLQTPAKNTQWSDTRLVNGRLILAWHADEKIHIWDMQKGELIQTVDVASRDIEDIRISEDGSKVFCLKWVSVGAWSTWTGESVGEVKLKGTNYQRSLLIDGSRAWVHCPFLEPQGWDFGIPGQSPVQLLIPPSLRFSGTKLWNIGLDRIKDTATGKVVFQLGGMFSKPIDVQLDSWYILARYQSGDVLILDFNHVFLQ